MSTAARGRRNRGPRRYLPIVLGLALLAAALGAGQGHPASGAAGSLAADRSATVVSAPQADAQPVAVEADDTGTATAPVEAPEAVPSGYPRVVVDRVPGVDAPRAPPRRGA